MRWTSNGVRFRIPFLSFFLIIVTGAKISGHRGYFLMNDGIDLNQALISYGLDFLRKRGYKKIQPPFMMNKDVMAKTAQLDQFDEELYKVLSIPHTRCVS
jgi:seryl-tRNA synthetase